MATTLLVDSLSVLGVQDMAAKNREFFGNPGYRINQQECINASLSGRDTFVLMPTGGDSLQTPLTFKLCGRLSYTPLCPP